MALELLGPLLVELPPASSEDHGDAPTHPFAISDCITGAFLLYLEEFPLATLPTPTPRQIPLAPQEPLLLGPIWHLMTATTHFSPKLGSAIGGPLLHLVEVNSGVLFGMANMSVPVKRTLAGKMMTVLPPHNWAGVSREHP